MAVQEIDQDLLDGLKLAKTQSVNFAVVLKGGADGALVVSKTKIPATAIAAAKKKSGGSAVIEGTCIAEDGKLVFEVDKLPAATVANVLKAIAKRDSGLSIVPTFRVAGLPSAPPATDVTQPQGTTPTETPKTESKGPLGPLPDAAKYEQALQTWEQAAAGALNSIDKLVSSLDAMDDELASAISGIIQKAQADFPDTVDDSLTELVTAATAGRVPEAEQGRMKSEIAIKAALAYLNNNAKTFDGCENNPFGVAVQIRAPLTEALKRVLIAVKK